MKVPLQARTSRGWLPLPPCRQAWRPAVAAILITASSSNVVDAHPSGLQAGDPWWQAWHIDPLVLTNLAFLFALYGWGLFRAWRRAGVGRGVPQWRAIVFATGLLAVLVALISPLDTLGDDLSWVHMTQHMMLMVVAAPLIVLGAPGLVGAWALPRAWRKMSHFPLWPRRAVSRRRLRRLFWNPLFVWLLHAIILWAWHLPALYELALIDPLVHDIEHLSFFLVACLFWRVAIDPRAQLRLNPGLSVLYLFTTSLHAMMLGVFMALSPSVWYPIYAGRTKLWGLSPLEDQQLAGLIMWMPGCAVYAIVAAGLLAGWLRELEIPRGRIDAAVARP